VQFKTETFLILEMEQKIILVTGANRGIGLQIVKDVAALGHIVILTARDETKGGQAAKELRRNNFNVHFIQLDAADETSIQRAAATVAEQFGKLDVLVNNAGIFNDTENSLKVSRQAVQEHLDVNFIGPLMISQAFIPLLEKSREGRIINFSSQMGRLNGMGGGSAAYRFSKTAINSLTTVMAADLAGKNIRVNSMCPGWVKTDMGGAGAYRSLEEGAGTAVWLATAEKIPTGKFFADRKETEW
jgi:NAD(P)-dependent dehydrogenase (short-subunit alcohol dehydrogenase family)